MLEVPFSETVDLFLNIDTSDFRRVRCPSVSQLADVEVPDLRVPAPLITKSSTLATRLTHQDANLLNDSPMMSHFASSLRMRFSAKVFSVGMSYCNEAQPEARHLESIGGGETDFIGKSVDGLGRRAGDLAIRMLYNFRASRSTTLFRSKRCKLDHVRVEVHQKSLEPAILSGEIWINDQLPLTSRTQCLGF